MNIKINSRLLKIHPRLPKGFKLTDYEYRKKPKDSKIPTFPINHNCLTKPEFNLPKTPFTEQTYKQIQQCMETNPGRILEDYVKLMDFMDFTVENLEYAFLTFNTYKHTFYGVCGPFLYKEDKDGIKRWFPFSSLNNSNSIILAQENEKLRNKIKELNESLSHIYEKN